MTGQRPLRVLITGGGTKVRIDDVRHLGNFAGGGFPTTIGNAFRETGAEVYLLGSEEMIRRIHDQGRADEFTHLTSFRWFEDLERELFAIIESWQPDIILMAAAVSD